MVREYTERLYTKAAAAERVMSARDHEAARELSAFKQRMTAHWPAVQVVHVESGGLDDTPQVGDSLHLRAQVQLDGISPADVSVEVVYGQAGTGDELRDVATFALSPSTTSATDAAGVVLFEGTLALSSAGAFGYTVRVVPKHAHLASPAELGLIATAH
jgi:starch phosphorylase